MLSITSYEESAAEVDPFRPEVLDMYPQFSPVFRSG